MNEIVNIKRTLFKEIKSLKINGLISISLIGSFQYAKKLDKVNDIDLVIVVKKLSPRDYEDIKYKFSVITKKLSNEKIKFLIETRRGPIKPNAIKERKVVQLHLLIYYLEYWEKIEGTIDFDSINFNVCLKGKNLDKVTPLPKLKKEWVLKDFEMHKNNLKKSKVRLLEWVNQKGKLERKELEKDFSLEEQYEGTLYAIICSFLNFVRYSKPKTTKKQKTLLIYGKKLLSKKNYTTLINAFKMKEILRNGINLRKKEVNSMKEKTLLFINDLEKQFIEKTKERK